FLACLSTRPTRISVQIVSTTPARLAQFPYSCCTSVNSQLPTRPQSTGASYSFLWLSNARLRRSAGKWHLHGGLGPSRCGRGRTSHDAAGLWAQLRIVRTAGLTLIRRGVLRAV